MIAEPDSPLLSWARVRFPSRTAIHQTKGEKIFLTNNTIFTV
jgi:hypothetical protein